jgi:cytochrome c1
MHRSAKIVLKTVALTVAVAVLGAAAVLFSGVYDISATDQHTKPVYWLIEATMQRSVQLRAAESETPDLSRSDLAERGFFQYRNRCLPCHGGPGIAPDEAALGMTPVPANLIPTTQQWSAAKIRWVVKNGIKMTGMPAWKYRMSDDEIWEVVAFVKQKLPLLSPREFQSMVASVPPARDDARLVVPTVSGNGSAKAGRRAIDQYGCATCHVIPGITGATRQVGPPLTDIASRSYIGGVLQNTPENMVRWLMHPQHVRPGTAMPDVRVRTEDARDIAAYLQTLKED